MPAKIIPTEDVFVIGQKTVTPLIEVEVLPARNLYRAPLVTTSTAGGSSQVQLPGLGTINIDASGAVSILSINELPILKVESLKTGTIYAATAITIGPVGEGQFRLVLSGSNSSYPIRFWDGSTDKFYLKTDGSVYMAGTVSAAAGSIGGWTISANALYHDGATDNVSSGMASADYPFYAGKKYVDRATAPFRVTPDGAIVCTGILTASAGSSIDWTYLTNIAVTNAHISESIVVGNTDAKCTDADADQTSANPQAIAWLSDSGNFGDMAWEDVVGLAKLDNTIIIGGYIKTSLLTADNIVTGTLAVAYSEAKCTDPNADQTSANPQTIAWLSNSGDFGNMAWEDLVGLAKLDTTVIVGGFIKTSLLTADNIVAGTLVGRTIKTYASGQRIEIRGHGDLLPDELLFYNSGENLTLEIFAGASETVIKGSLDTRPACFQGPLGHYSLKVYETKVLSEHLQPVAADKDIGLSGSKWRHIYLSGNAEVGGDVNVSDDINLGDDIWPDNTTPESTSSLGWSNNYFHQVYTNLSRWKTSQAFQKYDDIALMKKIKTKKIETREADRLGLGKKKIKGKRVKQEIWDGDTMPKEVYLDGFYDSGAINGFLIGTIKQLIEKVESLESKISELSK